MKNKKFYLMALSLALPAIFQQLLSIASQMADSIQVGVLGEQSVAGVTIANQIFFIFTILIFGTTATGGIFIAQYKGAKNEEKIKESFRISLIFASIIGIIFFALITLIPYQILSIFVSSRDTMDLSMQYFKYIKYTFLFFPIVITIASSYRYYGIVKLPMYVGMIGVSINIVLNYLLINGNMGFPALKVEGGALATFISRVVELVILLVCMKKIKSPINTRLVDIFKFEKELFKKYINKGYALVINEFFWSCGVQFTNILYARKITENVAAMGITTNFTNIIFVGMGGVSVAVSIIVGNNLGNSNFEEAYEDAKKLRKLGAFLGYGFGLLALLAVFFIKDAYQVQPQTLNMVFQMVSIACLFAGMYYLNASTFFTLRAGGDTKSVLIMDAIFMWVIVIPTLLFVNTFNLYMPLVYLIVQLLEILKLLLARYRFNRKHWLVNLTIKEEVII